MISYWLQQLATSHLQENLLSKMGVHSPVSLDLSDASADSDRYVVAGESSLYIAALDLVAQDEAADVKSFDVYATAQTLLHSTK
jgi:hypothetical protein